MPWAEKSFAYNGTWIKGVVQVPAVDEDLFEESDLEEAKKNARPFLTMLDDSRIINGSTMLTAGDVEAARTELWEIEFRLKSLTEEQDGAVEKLYREVLNRDGKPTTSADHKPTHF